MLYHRPPEEDLRQGCGGTGSDLYTVLGVHAGLMPADGAGT